PRPPPPTLLPYTTLFRSQDLLTSVRVPKLAAGTGWSYQKFHRRAIDWAIVGVAALVERDDGTVKRAAVGLTNMATTPLRAAGVEDRKSTRLNSSHQIISY